jgi:hypothetical protein
VRKAASSWGEIFSRNLPSLTRVSVHVGSKTVRQAMRPIVARREPPAGKGDGSPAWRSVLVFLDGHPASSTAVTDGASVVVAFTASSKLIEAVGFSGNVVRQRRRAHLK